MLNLTNAKLLQNLQILSDFIGRVDVGGTTAVTVQSLENESINSNDTLCVLSGVNAGSDIEIESFTNGVFDLGSNDKLLNKRDVIAVISIPLNGYIDQAERYMENDFRSKGALLQNFLNVSQIEQLHLYKTLMLICGDRRNGSDSSDAYNSNFDRFASMYKTGFSNLLADYDYDESGTIETSEELSFKSQVGFTR